MSPPPLQVCPQCGSPLGRRWQRPTRPCYDCLNANAGPQLDEPIRRFGMAEPLEPGFDDDDDWRALQTQDAVRHLYEPTDEQLRLFAT